MDSNFSYTDVSKDNINLNMTSNTSSEPYSISGLSEGQHLAVGIYLVIVGE